MRYKEWSESLSERDTRDRVMQSTVSYGLLQCSLHAEIREHFPDLDKWQRVLFIKLNPAIFFIGQSGFCKWFAFYSGFYCLKGIFKVFSRF